MTGGDGDNLIDETVYEDWFGSRGGDTALKSEGLQLAELERRWYLDCHACWCCGYFLPDNGRQTRERQASSFPAAPPLRGGAVAE
jgi:hypothetical protein